MDSRRSSVLSIFLVLVFLSHNAVFSTRIERVSKTKWDGVSAFLEVDRDKIQQKVDEYNDITFDGCSRPQLYLPHDPLFHGALPNDKHVVYLSFGKSTFLDFADPLDACSDVDIVNVMVPFLTDGLSRVPRYSFFVGRYYTRDRGSIYKPNFIAPYTPMDEVTIYNNGLVVMRNGTDELRVSIKRYTDPCKSVPSDERKEFEGTHDDSLQFGLPKPDFEVCNFDQFDNEFCSIVKGIACEVSRASPNICQISWGESGNPCDAEVEILSITPGFRDLMLLGDGSVPIIATESRNGTFHVGIKYPCIDLPGSLVD